MDCEKGPYAALDHRRALRDGLLSGVPIGMGYFAVAFSLGIAARSAGLTPFQGFLASLLTTASAGEYAAFTTIAARATVLELAAIVLVANARYLLMSCALTLRIAPDMPFFHRFFIGLHVTDEIFGVTVARSGYLDPFFCYGAMLTAVPPWAVGTALGIALGNLLPARAVSALSVALYGMFLAIIVPPARKSRVVLALVVGGFALSFLASRLLPVLSSGTRIILLTLLLAGLAAALFPVKEEEV